jgi:hypothetical protein
MCTAITILDIFYLKLNVSETGLCLRLKVKPAQFGPIDSPSLYIRTPATHQCRANIAQADNEI